ncbi:RNA-binding protein [Candidatus Roizmanbacteria bacterium]|nr:RNA-binding protein [Candidatus Roizmanbacteria bacterium]
MQNNKLYVGNLPWSMTNDTLREMFSQFGEITDAVVISDRMTGRSKGFGFVTFDNEESAGNAVRAMNEQEVEGRKIIVNVARPKEESRNGGGNSGFRPHRRSY